MSPGNKVNVTKIKTILEEFLNLFGQYSKEIFGSREREKLDEIRGKLQKMEPLVTHYLLQINGEGTFITGSFGIRQRISHRDLLSVAIMGGNNEEAHNFNDYKDCVTSFLNKAIGRIDSGLWPPTETEPTLVIKDNDLRQRCFDLLQAPDNFDRVIREATVILEDRIRNKVPHEMLSTLIPLSKDQNGERLVEAFFSPKKPILIFSSDEHERLAFFKILIGVFSYLRNPLHHKLDEKIEWSWAWSTVGLIDRLLTDIESCVLQNTSGDIK